MCLGALATAFWVMHLTRTAMAPCYRFIDPALRPETENAAGAGAQVKPADAMLTAHYPVASLLDETRYVLTPIAHDALVYSEAAPVPPDGHVTLFARLPDVLQHSERVAMAPQIRIGRNWRSLPDFVVPSERVGTELWAHVSLTLPDAAGQSIGVQVECFAVSRSHTTAYRTAEVTIPKAAQLAFGIGIEQPAWSQGPVVFTIKSCESERCEPLYSESLDPTNDAGQGWHDRKVSLKELAGRKRSLLFETRLDNDDERAFSFPLWANPTIYPLHAGSKDRVNVVLLSIDTLSARHLPLYGYDHDTAPFITETFGQHGTVFDRCVAAAATTTASHMSMFTSLQPAVHGVTTGILQTAPEWLVTLAEVLRAHGFETGAVTEDGWLGTQFGFGRGFNMYVDNKSPDIMEPKGRVDVTFGKAKEWLVEHRDQPFFLFLHTFQVHAPYVPPPQYNRFFTQYGGQTVADDSPRAARDRANYDREIRHTDDQLRLLFQTIAEQGLADKTIFILVSDHGEEFFEHGYWGHGADLYEEVTHVPLLFWGPGHIPAGRRVSQQVGHIDLLPTILDLAHVRIPSMAAGVSLVPLLNGGAVPKRMVNRALFSEAWSAWATLPDYTPMTIEPPGYMVQLGTRKLSRYRREGKLVYELYDLAQDPGEKQNIFDEQNADIAALRRQLDEYESSAKLRAMALELAADWRAKGTPTPVHLDAGQEEKLRALGYLK